MIKRKLVIVIDEKMEFTSSPADIHLLAGLRDEFIEAVEQLRQSLSDEVFIECTVLKNFLSSMVETITKTEEERRKRKKDEGEEWRGDIR